MFVNIAHLNAKDFGDFSFFITLSSLSPDGFFRFLVSVLVTVNDILTIGGVVCGTLKGPQVIV